MNLSIVIPLLNEEESLPELHDWIKRVMDEHKFSYEILFIDDGSKDKVTLPNDKEPNTNSQKIAQIVRENIATSSVALLRGVITVSEKIDQQGRTIVVEVKTGVTTDKVCPLMAEGTFAAVTLLAVFATIS